MTALSKMTLGITMKNATLSKIMTNVTLSLMTFDTGMPSVTNKPIMLSFVMLNVVTLSVVAPKTEMG